MSGHYPILQMFMYGAIYAAFGMWTSKSTNGIALKKYLQEWKTDWVHGIMVSVSVFILFCCGILAAALILDPILK